MIWHRWVSRKNCFKKIHVPLDFYKFLLILFAGAFQMKVRQLKVQGMTVIPVPWFEFTPLDRPSRLMYLDKHISVVNSKRL